MHMLCDILTQRVTMAHDNTYDIVPSRRDMPERSEPFP